MVGRGKEEEEVECSKRLMHQLLLLPEYIIACKIICLSNPNQTPADIVQNKPGIEPFPHVRMTWYIDRGRTRKVHTKSLGCECNLRATWMCTRVQQRTG